MSLSKLLGLAREILADIITASEDWLEAEETLESALQTEINGYQGSGFLDNWILADGAILEGYTRQILDLDDNDQEELEQMIRDLAIDYLAGVEGIV